MLFLKEESRGWKQKNAELFRGAANVLWERLGSVCGGSANFQAACGSSSHFSTMKSVRKLIHARRAPAHALVRTREGTGNQFMGETRKHLP